MRTVITLKFGDKYTSNDVNYIYDNSNIYRHVCITDDPTGLNSNIEIMPIDSGADGCWEKIKIFKHDWVGDCLYLDLDVIIQGSLDRLFNHCSTPTICYCYWKNKNTHETKNKRYQQKMRYLGDGLPTDPWMQKWKGLYNSSVMVWSGNDARYIYDHFEKNDEYFMTKYCGDDRFLYHENMFNNVFPKGLIYSLVGGVDFDTDVSPRGYQIKPDYPIVLLNGNKPKEELRKKYYDALSLHEMG